MDVYSACNKSKGILIKKTVVMFNIIPNFYNFDFALATTPNMVIITYKPFDES